ncbi:uncharacterized protein PV06_05197 [Exophiala oligosperma]|uniref:Uncharacterized protein n=2 Tax=Chaetothyriales TaxID=34395 RepID=A0A0D2C311_9EURO|nr:uncharacterized protein PV06_05197 [Exophiala oligosperma]KAJ9644215.1 hypothetical protein H2204_001566 [Knufia peltigerae]KIW44167.1 hypothetical protein PV06_05197 [Exophiala oligosperma]
MSLLSLGSRLNVHWRILVLIFVAVISSYTILHTLAPTHLKGGWNRIIPSSSVSTSCPSGHANQHLTKPDGVKVIGMVFYGRRDRSQILHCFLMRNLVDNGGWLDEVQWIRNTDNEADLQYLDEILIQTPRYKQVHQERTKDQGYSDAWSKLDPGQIYVKIDDDLVWMADDAIPRLVTTKLEHPEYLVVSANMINSPLLGWLHYRMGAVHPYLPAYNSFTDSPSSFEEISAGTTEQTQGVTRVSWKHIDHPAWTGPDSFSFPHEEPPPLEGHAWLRLLETQESRTHQLRRTPVINTTYETWGPGLKSWSIAAQHHYSFLENLHDDNLHLYKFAPDAKPWITDYDRLSINFIAINSTEILTHLPIPDDVVDEEWLTVTLPRQIGKSVAVDTQALGVHFSFFFQGQLTSTDLLGRYLDYAKENVCLKS